MPTVTEVFDLAVQHHRAGDIARAEQLYQDVCRADPAHADAHHMLGVLAYQQGHLEKAVPAFRHAVTLNPDAADYRNNLGLALQAAELLEEAETNYRQALRLHREMPEAHCNLGNVLFRLGKVDEAGTSFREALRLAPYDSKAHCGLGLVLESKGRCDEAEAHYRQALNLQPDYAEAHNNLAHLLCGTGRVQESLRYARYALSLKPDFVEAHANVGNALLMQARWSDAEQSFRMALHMQPGHLEAHHGLGLALERQGRLDEAASSYGQVLRLDPTHAAANYNLANTLACQSKLVEAIKHYQDTVRINPNFALAWNNLGCVLARQENFVEAAAALREAIRAQPDYPEAHCNLANALMRSGQPAEAAEACHEAIRLRPDYAVAYTTLGTAIHALGSLQEAAACFDRALELQPDYAEPHNLAGNLLMDLGEFDRALQSYQRAVALKPDFADAHNNVALLLAEQGRLDEADLHLRESMRLKPAPSKRLVQVLRVPPINQSMDDLLASRRKLCQGIDKLLEEGLTIDLATEPACPSFYPPYHGFNDRELQRSLARFYRPPADSVWAEPRIRGDLGGRVRVGFISRFLKEHTIGKLMRGVIATLSRERFHVSVLSIGAYSDSLAKWLKENSDNHVELPPTFPAARRTIADKHLDVLFYTDIGMEPATYTLGFSRMAPVQCVTWGHPITTGIPSMDYFISSELLEGKGAEDHYTEKLVQLKNLAIYYYRPVAPLELKNRGSFKLPESGTFYLCPQSLFKFHPSFDEILAGILRRDTTGTLGLVKGKHQYLQELLMRRFSTTMPDVMDRVVFIPPQTHADFMNLNALADVLLDPVHFGGGNTSYEGFALGVPVVTMPSEFLRGRITLALYKQMGIMDCVVSNPAEYIDLAVKLGTDRAERNRISAKILAANDVLFENPAGVRELEEFLLKAVDEAR